jgi:hypothetical protein
MSNITPYEEDDDGYSGTLTGGRLIKGQLLRWNETNGWTDRDGLRPPEIVLAVALSEALQCWKGKKPIETITAKPLPDIETLNKSVPERDWELGLDGKPKAPWVHQVVVYLLDPATAGTFTYLNSTVGARIGVDHLREKVITMRALRGSRVIPAVRLSHRPMKTFVEMKHRPEFEVVGWKQLGGDAGPTLPNPQSPPQLTGPASAPAPATAPSTSPQPKPTTMTAAADETLGIMEEVSVPNMGEILNDSVPW